MRHVRPPLPRAVVTPQLQPRGQARLQHVVRVALQHRARPARGHPHLALRDGARRGAAAHRVVQQQAAVRVQRLAARRRAHAQLEAAAGGDEAGAALQVPAQGQQAEPLLPHLHAVLAPRPRVPQRQVRHLQLHALAALRHHAPHALAAAQVVARVAGAGDVALARHGHAAAAVAQHARLAAVAEVGAAAAPAGGLGQVPRQVEGAGAAAEARAAAHHGQQDVAVVGEGGGVRGLVGGGGGALLAVSVRGEGGLVRHDHLALRALQLQLRVAAAGELVRGGGPGEERGQQQEGGGHAGQQLTRRGGEASYLLDNNIGKFPRRAQSGLL